jgi:hypothetical protein
MMRLAAALLLMVACASTADVPLDTPFTLKHGETRGPVTFVEVSDSRCPRNAVCVWQGEVSVQLSVNSENVTIKVPGTATAAGYQIEVREVTPYPDDPPPAKSTYRAVVVVSTVDR